MSKVLADYLKTKFAFELDVVSFKLYTCLFNNYLIIIII